MAIAVAVRVKEGDRDRPARVHYARLEGTRREKLAALEGIDGFRKVAWKDAPGEWQAPFRPAGEGAYFTWPLLTDLMPWQHSGAQLKRTWPIAPDVETLERRWRELLAASGSEDRARDFRETRDRKVTAKYAPLFETDEAEDPVAALPSIAPAPRRNRYAYRSFDRQWVFADTRLGDYLRPALWRVHGERQIYLTGLFHHPLGRGPAVTACSHVPDLDHFRGSYGAKAVVPLYRAPDASEANVLPGLLDELRREYGRSVTPEDFLGYVYGVLAHPAFTARFADELETRQLRVPLTRDPALFEAVRSIGARLLRLHTYGQRLARDPQRGRVPRGAARCARAVPGDPDAYPETFRYDESARTLHVGEGRFEPVAPSVYAFEVSGLKVVQSWLGYRMKRGAGRRSSRLDAVRPRSWTGRFTTELLELLWVLEATLEDYPAQARLLDAVVASECLRAGEIPPVPAVMRAPPARPNGPLDAGSLL